MNTSTHWKQPWILAFLPLVTLVPLHAADEEIRLAIPSSAMESAASASLFPAPKYIIPDFAQPGERNEEIKVPEALTAEETLVLTSAEKIPTEELSDLLQVYERMGNTAMVQSLSRILIVRVPDHPIVRQMLDGITGKAEIRRPDYLEKKANEVLAGNKSSDPEAVGAQARALIAAKDSERAIALLEALRLTTYLSQTFPFLEDLGYANIERQRWDHAESAFAEVIQQKALPERQRQRIAKYLELARAERRIAAVRAQNYADPEAALQESNKILRELPEHPSAIAFQVECLQYAGKSSQAAAMLQKLKAVSASAHAPAFAYQRLLGDTYTQMKQWDSAQAAFEELRANPTFANEVRVDAVKSITTVSVSKQGEEALMAAGFGDWEKAETMLSEMERQYPSNIEVFSYRCALLARLGRSDEAMRLLITKKSQMANTGKPFQLQDTIGDVHVAHKEFDAARADYREILNEPKYDWSMRRRALDAMPAIRRVELMEAGFLALRDRRLSRAKAAAQALEDEFGAKNRELRLLTAEIHLAQNNPKQAVKELEDLRRTAPPNAPFEATSSLATGKLATGKLDEALLAYNDILANYRAYTPYEGMQARWELRSAIPLAKPNIETIVSHRSETDGSVTRADVIYSGPWWGDWRAQAFSHADFINLKNPLLGVDSPLSDERFEAGVRIQRRISELFAAEIMLGGSQDDILYGAKVGNFLNPGLSWFASFNGNGRSTDSIPLEALNARENRIDVGFGGPLPGPWNFDLRASANWVRVGSIDVGHGFGGSAALEYLIQTETEKRPEIAIGYLGEYRQFTSSDANGPFASLVDSSTHRHGLTAAYRRNLNDSWRLSAQVGGFYAIDEASFQYMASLSLAHYFNDHFMAYLDLRYDSNSRSALQDTGSFEAVMGLSRTF